MIKPTQHVNFTADARQDSAVLGLVTLQPNRGLETFDCDTNVSLVLGIFNDTLIHVSERPLPEFLLIIEVVRDGDDEVYRNLAGTPTPQQILHLLLTLTLFLLLPLLTLLLLARTLLLLLPLLTLLRLSLTLFLLLPLLTLLLLARTLLLLLPLLTLLRFSLTLLLLLPLLTLLLLSLTLLLLLPLLTLLLLSPTLLLLLPLQTLLLLSLTFLLLLLLLLPLQTLLLLSLTRCGPLAIWCARLAVTTRVLLE